MSLKTFFFEKALDFLPDRCEGCRHLIVTRDVFGTGDSPTDYECNGNERVCPVAEELEREAMITKQDLEKARLLIPYTNIDEHLIDGKHFVYVVRDGGDGEVVGIIDSLFEGGVSTLESIGVDEDFRRMGIGTELITAWLSESEGMKRVVEFDDENGEMHLLMRKTEFVNEGTKFGITRYTSA